MPQLGGESHLAYAIVSYLRNRYRSVFFFFFQAEDGIRDVAVTGVQTCALPISFSKSIDNASSFESILRPICDRCNRALSLFDARHRFVLSYLWSLPVPEYQGAKGKVLNGWQVSGITTLQTGFPIRLESSNDSELENSFDFELPGKPDLIAPFRTFDPRTHGGLYFDPNSFALPVQDFNSTPLQLLGNAPRTICCGPGISNFDFSVQKVTRMGEKMHLAFRAEFFSIFTHP